VTILRSKMAMNLNNSGDIISLISSSNELIDEFSYSTYSEGTSIITQH
jgi:hypothetical protein